MIPSTAPVADILFSLRDVAGAADFPDWDDDLAGDILSAFASFAEGEIAPLDLPPAGPSFIAGVCRLDLGIRLPCLTQARRARSPQIAQAFGALAAVSGWPGTSVA